MKIATATIRVKSTIVIVSYSVLILHAAVTQPI